MKGTRALLALLVVLLLPACGGSSGGSAAPAAPPDPDATITTPASVQSGDVAIAYNLIDAESELCSLEVEFSVDGGATFNPATPAAGGDGLAALASSPSPGTAHVFMWNSLIDGVATGAADADVRVRVHPSNSVPGGVASTGDFTVDNSANTPPAVTVPTVTGSAGLITVSYTLSDTQSNVASIDVRYSTDGGATFSPAAAFQGPGGDGIANLASSPGGVAHSFTWNSFEDLGATDNASVQVRVTPTDGSVGAPQASSTFAVNNAGLASGDSVGGAFPLLLNPYYVITAIRTDGRHLYVASHDHDAWRLAKLDAATGAAVWTQDSDPSGGDDRATDMVIDGTYMYVMGFTEIAPFGGSTERAWRLEKRLLSDGTLVASFGTAGVVDWPNSGDSPVAVLAIDSANAYVTGVVEEPIGSGVYTLRTEKRLLSDGSLVTGFGTGGVIAGNGGICIAVDSTSMYLGAAQDIGADMKLRIEKRRLSDGALDSSFGTGGAVVVNADPTAGVWELVGSIAIDDTHLYTYENVESGLGTDLFPWRVTRRDLATGTSDVTVVVGTGTSNQGPSGGFVGVYGSRLYVTGRDGASGTDGQWRVEARSSSTLALDTSFNGTGIITFNPVASVDEDWATALVETGGVVFIAGTDDTPARRWRIESRFR